MQRYIRTNEIKKDFRRYYTTTLSNGNRYQVIAEGQVEDDTLKLRVSRSTSNGRKIYAYAIVGQQVPGRIEVYYQGQVVKSEDYGSFLESPYDLENSFEYFDELAYEAVLLTDEVNEEYE